MMTRLISTSLSGLNAASMALGASAHNIANAQVPGFRRQQVETRTSPAGGVDAEVVSAAPGDGDLTADVVGLLQSKNAWLANLAVFRASSAMSGSLLDAVA